jgi:uncharacterized protein
MINPGLLKGFYLPIYGFGALFVLGGHVILDTYSLPIRSLFYLISLSVLELITGAAIEKFLHVRLWDYRDNRFNIRGHVCLLFSIYWILLATGLDVALDFLIPWALHVYERFDFLIDVVLGSMALAMLIDFIVVMRRRMRERSGPADQDTAR